jgi:hypothetical protein
MAIEQGGCVGGTELALSAAVVLDPRLAEIWQLVWECAAEVGEPDEADWSLETLGALLRLAYVQGYSDATAEAIPGSLFGELGLRRPRPVIRPTASGNRRARGEARRDNSDR